MPFLHTPTNRVRPSRENCIPGRVVTVGVIISLLLAEGCFQSALETVRDVVRSEPSAPSPKPPSSPSEPSPQQTEGWHWNITATYFDIAKYPTPQTAWNDEDALDENPYYLALPFNDRVPGYSKYGPCKNRWVELVMVPSGRRAYGQWEDVGPWFVNDVDYVFDRSGNVRPFAEIHKGDQLNIYRKRSGSGSRRPRKILNEAGIDLSPGLAQALGIRGKGEVHWRFVDARQVPSGPWRQKISTDPPRYRKRFYMLLGERFHPWELTTTRFLR